MSVVVLFKPFLSITKLKRKKQLGKEVPTYEVIRNYCYYKMLFIVQFQQLETIVTEKQLSNIRIRCGLTKFIFAFR